MPTDSTVWLCETLNDLLGVKMSGVTLLDERLLKFSVPSKVVQPPASGVGTHAE